MQNRVQNRATLLWGSFLALIVAGVGFAVRGGLLKEWGSQFGFTQLELGTITGGGLVGFGIVILLASQVTDRLGYKTILLVAFVLHLLSVLVTVAATPIYLAAGKAATFQCLYWGMFMFAVANGLCETVVNPLVANLYPEKKTHYLNILHAGWPAGLIAGGLLATVLVGTVRWEIPMALYVIPTLWYGYIVLGQPFPKSEVTKAKISYGEMLKEFAKPVLLFLILLHACVGYVELGTDSWIANITEILLSGQGLKLFIYAASIMFVLRFFAGPIVERINPLGLLCASTVLGTSGLLLLGSAKSAAWIWIAVTIYGFGKTFLWPTMLGVVGERFPRGGAITMGAMGAAGTLSAGLLGGPSIGYKQDYFATQQLTAEAPGAYDRYAADEAHGFLVLPKIKGLNNQKVEVLLELVDGQWAPATTLRSDYQIAAAQESIPPSLQSLQAWWDKEGYPHEAEDHEPVQQARIFGAQMALKLTAIVPACMFVGFLLLVLYFRGQGGYRQVDISEEK